MQHDKSAATPPKAFHPIGRRMVRMVVMVAVFCALAAIALQTLYGIRTARAGFDARVKEITASRLPMLSTALWDIEPRLAQSQINEVAAMPQIAGVRLVTAAGITLQAGHTPPGPASAVDASLDILPPSGKGSALGRLQIDFDHSYLVRQVLVDTALTAGFIGIFTLLLCVLLIRFLRAEISLPLQRLAAHVDALSPDALDVPYSSGRAERPWNDELDQLAQGFASLHGGIARFVDERNRAEAALAQERDQLEMKVAERTRDLESARDKADQASRSKSEFLANMSHEIRTPINAITGFTALALRTELSPKQADYLAKINGAAQGLLHIISDLLDFSKIEAGYLEIERIPFQLRDVMDNTLAYIGSLAERKGLTLTVQVAPDLPSQWLGDPLRLGQILTNLCSNAVKFTQRGEVQVRAALASRTASSGRLLVTVRDTGIGLSPEQAGKLFHAFTQADASTTRKFGGTGLGLAISQRLAGMMNGRLWLESQEGAGTTFFLEIELGLMPESRSIPPQREPVAGGQATPATGRARLQGVRLLLLEDNPINQQLARELLEQEGAEMHVADNGRIGLEAVQAFGIDYFDAALVDLQMPEMDGYEAVRRIRQLPSGESLPMLAVTAHAMLEERQRCLAAGMKDHIAKPIDLEVMVTKLRQWIGPGKLARAAKRKSDPADSASAEVRPDTLPAALPGIVVSDGLQRCQGDQRLFQDLLTQFHHHYADAATQMRQLCASGRASDAYMLAHTIKGAAANLGMPELAAAAAALEELLKVERQGVEPVLTPAESSADGADRTKADLA